MQSILDIETAKQIMLEFNHKTLQVIIKDYYRTYSVFNENLAKVLSDLENVVTTIITNIYKDNESHYVVTTLKDTYNVECKNGKWNIYA